MYESSYSQAFDDVYRRHHTDLMRSVRQGFALHAANGSFMYHAKPSAADAEDIVQEAFRRLFECFRSGAFDRERPVAPYLKRIALNVSMSQRTRARREVPGLPYEPTVGGDVIDARECGRLLGEFKAKLAPRDRRVMSKYFEEGEVSQAAVGAALGLSRDQVARSVHKIRRKASFFFGRRGWARP